MSNETLSPEQEKLRRDVAVLFNMDPDDPDCPLRVEGGWVYCETPQLVVTATSPKPPPVEYQLDPANLVIEFPEGQEVRRLFDMELNRYAIGYEVVDAIRDLIEMHGGRIQEGWTGFELIPRESQTL